MCYWYRANILPENAENYNLTNKQTNLHCVTFSKNFPIEICFTYLSLSTAIRMGMWMWTRSRSWSRSMIMLALCCCTLQRFYGVVHIYVCTYIFRERINVNYFGVGDVMKIKIETKKNVKENMYFSSFFIIIKIFIISRK